MKKLIVLLFSVLFVFKSIAQKEEAVRISVLVENNNGQYLLKYKAIIAKDVLLIALKKATSEDVFKSTITYDSSSQFFLKDSLINEKKYLEGKDESSELIYQYVKDSATWIQKIDVKDTAIIKGYFTWLAKVGDTFISGEKKFNEKIVKENSVNNESEKSSNSLLAIFLLTFFAGLIAVITPCVFPLIPVTVSFFLKRSKSKSEGLRNAVWYSLCIILIYTIPTIILTLIFGDTVLYTISTHAISNLLFFLIFIVFAISFFGAFELTLPNSWANKADQQAGKGGLSGIFFMALTLVIVSFSCTGPIVGTLLGQTSSQGVSIAPIIGMLGFGVGLALPFSLFAFFPSMLQSLPKSGGWLNTVKVTFGFIELALALKFLSNVDLIYHWHLLNRDVFLVLWIVIFGLMGLYLLGKIKFSHDSEVSFVSIPRLFFAMASLSFSLYMIPGLWGAPLKPLSGFIPPATTQTFNLEELKYQIENLKIKTDNSSNNIQPKKYTDKLHVPFGLTAFFDLDEGMQAAKLLNKPVMLDFTGHSCANCRKMEEQVWKDENVLKRIKENFVLISLYVDESTELPISEQYTNSKGDKITTVGEKNLDYEITKFGFNAQPLYMFLDLDGKPLSDIKYGYDSDINKFVKHLDFVVEEFKKK